MHALSYLLLLMSAAWLVGVSVFMFVRPQTALRYLAKFASTNLINYAELSLRMISGVAFMIYADSSRYPQSFFLIGCFLVGTAGILMLIPRRWHAQYAVYWSRKLTPSLVRMAAPFSLLAGLLVILVMH